MLRMSRRPLLLLWRIALIHAKLPDVIIQSVVIRNPQIGTKCDILLGLQFNKVLIGTFHMPVFQIVHIEAGHDMTDSHGNQISEG